MPSPHEGQNRASAGTLAPQWGHAEASEAPQLAQKLAASGLIDPQLGHAAMRGSLCGPVRPEALS